MSWRIATCCLTALAGVARADGGVGVGVGVPADPPPAHPIVVGVHAGAGRVVVSSDAVNATGYSPWVDVEAGAYVRPRLAVLGFAGYAHDSASDIDPDTSMPVHHVYNHVAAGARVQVDIAPSFWVGAGLAYMHESDAFDRVHGTQDVTGTTGRSSPALELRAGYDAARLGHVRLQVIADGIAFQPDSAGYISSIATLSLGAQWR